MIFSFLFIYIFVVNIVYYVVHIVCEVDVIANSLVLYLPFCSTLNKNFFFSSLYMTDINCHIMGICLEQFKLFLFRPRLKVIYACRKVRFFQNVDRSLSLIVCHTIWPFLLKLLVTER